MASTLNLATVKTPGVYIDEVSLFPPSVAQVETAIPAFIGYTQKAELPNRTKLTNIPTRITSLLEYTNFFGGPPIQKNLVVTLTSNASGDPEPLKAQIGTIDNNDAIVESDPSLHRMYYALRMYFANGGGPCYIVSVGDYDSVPASTSDIATALGKGGGGALAAVRKIDEITLILWPDAEAIVGQDSSGDWNVTDYYDLYEAGLSQCMDLKDRFVIMDVVPKFKPDLATGLSTPIDAMRSSLVPVDPQVLRYGAIYHPYLATTLTYEYDDDAITFFQPNGSFHNKTLSAVKSDATLARSVTNLFEAQLDSVISQTPVVMPPSSAIAGIYAAIDNNRGVWKAPANAGITFVSHLLDTINDEEQAPMNVHPSGKSVNAIRAFVGKGILVWGARTLDGNSNEWRYVSVRRFFNMVEESVKKGTHRFVFEPNDANTWAMVRAMIENFLLLQWRAGALAGAVPEAAFFVRVGLGSTMTALDILEGRMIIEIGMAVVRPAEFIILKFSHKMQES